MAQNQLKMERQTHISKVILTGGTTCIQKTKNITRGTD